MELYGFMEREKKIPSYFFIITKRIVSTAKSSAKLLLFYDKLTPLKPFFTL